MKRILSLIAVCFLIGLVSCGSGGCCCCTLVDSGHRCCVWSDNGRCPLPDAEQTCLKAVQCPECDGTQCKDHAPDPPDPPDPRFTSVTSQSPWVTSPSLWSEHRHGCHGSYLAFFSFENDPFLVDHIQPFLLGKYVSFSYRWGITVEEVSIEDLPALESTKDVIAARDSTQQRDDLPKQKPMRAFKLSYPTVGEVFVAAEVEVGEKGIGIRRMVPAFSGNSPEALAARAAYEEALILLNLVPGEQGSLVPGEQGSLWRFGAPWVR